jgi:peptidoglycan-associated lipoprotein
LGQKRAVALKKALNIKGISDSQIETVSFGEEKPKDEGHNEQAWSQNRRDDIVYEGE